MRGSWALLTLVATAACAQVDSRRALRLAPYPRQHTALTPAFVPTAPVPPAATPQAAPQAPDGERLELGLDRERLELGRGRFAIRVEVPSSRLVSVAVAGRPGVLREFEVIGRRGLRKLRSARHDDGLPEVVSFRTGETAEPLTVVVDADQPVALLRTSAAPFDATAGAIDPLPLVGMPFPLERKAGYEIVGPARYSFVRSDVAEALRVALRQTKKRLRKKPIGIGDASQWNGDRPAADLGRPRHISHAGGRDVDIGLPATAGDSHLTARCQVVLLETDRAACAPGTVKDFDAERLAYFLALVIDGPTPGGRFVAELKDRAGPIAQVETIFTDQVYIDEVRKVLPELFKKKWIHEEAFGALGEEGILRASPWHVDHVHIRFRGAPAVVPETFRF